MPKEGEFGSSIEAALVYFPYRNAMFVRKDVAKLDITEEAYKKFYFKRYDVSGSSMATATRIQQPHRGVPPSLRQAPCGARR